MKILRKSIIILNKEKQNTNTFSLHFVKNIVSSILTIRKDIDPLGISHVCIYGTGKELNNQQAIESWISTKNFNNDYSFSSILYEFNEKINDYYL